MSHAAPTTATPTWRQRLKLAVFSLIPVVVLLGIGHCTASVALYRHLSFDIDSLTGVTTYRMRVGGWPWIEPTSTTLNSMGFPDVDYRSLPPKGNCFHIVLTGDSFTFGDASDGDKSWAGLLRAKVTTAFPGRCVRVFNIAAPMTTVQQQLARFRETRAILQPDLVLLGQYQNDITDLTNWGGVAHREATDTSETTFWGDRLRMITPGFDSPLPRMLTYRAFHFLGERRIKLDILRRWSVLADTSYGEYAQWLTGIYRAMFDTLVTEVRATGAQFGTVILPSKMDIIALRYPEGEYFAGLARARGVPHLELFPVFDRERQPFPFLLYDGHLNETGNRLVAREVFAWLFTGPEAPFPGLRRGLGEPAPPVRVRWFPQ